MRKIEIGKSGKSAALRLILLLCTLMFAPAAFAADNLEKGFLSPPDSARPWVYWFWVNGNITREGITADLEAMQRAGIGGVLIFEVIQAEPVGPVRFGGPEWFELIQYACAEADRLDLEVNMNNGKGWAGSGGPWITPDLSMQKIVWSEATAEGPQRLETTLPPPPTEKNYYRDIRVLAFPTPSGDARIGNLACKTCLAFARPTGVFPVPADWPETPPAEVVSCAGIVDLTDAMDNTGKLAWNVPDGQWTILRLGHTSTGHGTYPAGSGLECDKMSKEAIEVHFAGLMSKLIAQAGPLVGKSLVAVHIDSWECGTQNWTPQFREEFQRRRGYDLLPYLPAITGRIVQSREISERFLWDFRQTINELVLENYAGHFRELANQNGLRFTNESYTTCPCDELSFAGRADEPMSEIWWSPRFLASWSTPAMTSGGHVWGKRIIGAEAFSSDNNERWLAHPAILKELGDWAFCEGINRLVFHRYAMQPWVNLRPGMGMGWWGVHYERTQTWWEMSTAWHKYLTRCQHLLRQGLFTADICYLSGEGMPQSLSRERRLMSKSLLHPLEPRERTGYNFDICPPDALMERMSVKDGRLVLPDGMSYRLLVLPMVETMTPKLLTKIKQLIEAGATVVGSRPSKSPSLSSYPHCDHEIKRITEELWGSGEAPARLTGRKIGKGWLFWSAAFQKKPETAGTPAEQLGPAQWIWYPDGENHWVLPAATRYFRRTIEVDAAHPVQSAQLVMTAYESLTCWVNGQLVGSVFDPLANYRYLTADLGSLLKPGRNLIAVEANNGTVGPCAAGLIAALRIEYRDGFLHTVYTDNQWESARTVSEYWMNDITPGEGWTAAREFGPLAPWEELNRVSADTQMLPEEELVNEVLGKLGVSPDFDYQSKSGTRSLRFTHRTLDGADIYFVANKLAQAQQALCSFRVQGKQPELWWPQTGRMERPAVYSQTGGITSLPICFHATDSVFVIFREKSKDGPDRFVSVTRNGDSLLDTFGQMDAITLNGGKDGCQALIRQPGTYVLQTAAGQTRELAVPALPSPLELSGPWQLSFPPHGGAPDQVTLDTLISWSEHTDPGVKYFSGTAVYTKEFPLSPDLLAKNRRLSLDLGEVQVMAEVKLNGKDLGILWKPPFCVDITDAAAANNRLEIKVVNLWINRMIGDEFLPEDCSRNPDGTLKEWPQWVIEGKPSPTGRYTFTSWKLWSKDEPLQPSGLLGPVTIRTAEQITLP